METEMGNGNRYFKFKSFHNCWLPVPIPVSMQIKVRSVKNQTGFLMAYPLKCVEIYSRVVNYYWHIYKRKRKLLNLKKAKPSKMSYVTGNLMGHTL